MSLAAWGISAPRWLTLFMGKHLAGGGSHANITLSVDEAIIKEVRKNALDKNTTLTEMVRKFLRSVAESDLPERERTLRRLETSFRDLSRDKGKRKWKREDFHGP
jgi:hypothetical protein